MCKHKLLVYHDILVILFSSISKYTSSSKPLLHSLYFAGISVTNLRIGWWNRVGHHIQRRGSSRVRVHSQQANRLVLVGIFSLLQRSLLSVAAVLPYLFAG